MAFTEDYRECFNVARRNVSDQARKYLNGLLVKAPRKNMERMEEYVGEFDYQSQQQFLSDSPWSHEAVMDRIALDVSEILGGKHSALILDESGFSKKGEKSVGVSRQYNGRLGKVDNCQVGVFASLTDGKSASLVGARLFLPESWSSDPERCEKAKVPEEHIQHLSKPEMALQMIERARRLGLRFGWVCFDALYGSSGELLRSLDEAGECFVADVKANRKVCPEGRSGGDVHIAKCFLEPSLDWKMVNVRMGEKGVLQVQACARRVRVGGEEGPCWWAVCVKDTQTVEIKWFLSNAPEDTALETLVRQHALRFWIERGFQDGKTSVGMGDYQSRGWVAWHHHMAMVMLAMLFMLQERRVHMLDVELLSCNDIVELLNVFLPRRDMTVEQVLANIERRHIKRKLAQESARRRPRKRSKDAINIVLTK
jgi:SRSO17 transposase